MVVWSVIGIIVGLIIFLLLMNLKNYNDEKKQYQKDKKEYDEEKKLGTKPRYCPVCRSRLGPRDVIYAEIFQGEPRDRVIIKGCKYCYILTPEEAMRIKPYTKKIKQDDIGVGKYV
ncbi:MAG: hypothetical protein N2712_01595 [Brevinematales bacterium]|nr:hypothetical protein [Brevinematales bacterium]